MFYMCFEDLEKDFDRIPCEVKFSSVEKANQYCDFLHTVLDMHAFHSLWKAINHKSFPWFESIRD